MLYVRVVITATQELYYLPSTHVFQSGVFVVIFDLFLPACNETRGCFHTSSIEGLGGVRRDFFKGRHDLGAF